MSVLTEPMTAPEDTAGRSTEARLRNAVTTSLALLRRTALEAGDQVSWPTWVMGPSGTAQSCEAGRSTLYDGDAGIAWAVRRLAEASARPDLAELGRRAVTALRHRPTPADPGLFAGAAGVGLAAGPGAWRHWDPARLVVSLPTSDLTSGLAGTLLALTRVPDARADTAQQLVAALWRRSQPQLWGRGWPDPTQHGDAARPLCGLAHGASGVVWALAEAALRWPRVADAALSLAHDGLRFEAAWASPQHGGWPDLRDREPVWAARWCHGAAGAAAVRLRLLELSAHGLDAPWSDATIRAELEMAVQACGAEVWRERQAWQQYGADGLGRGWTLCHGIGSTAAVLDLAASALGEPAHRRLALDAAGEFLDLAGPDPARWPSGLSGAEGDLSLFNGVAGTAVLLADLARLTPTGDTPRSRGPAVLLGGVGAAVG